MSIEALEGIESEIWEKLISGGKLSSLQEETITTKIKNGELKIEGETKKVIEYLRENTSILREKTWEELTQAVESLKLFQMYSFDKHLETAIKTDFEAALVNAQANRIENTIEKAQLASQEALKAAMVPKQVEIPKFDLPKCPEIREFPRIDSSFRFIV